MYILYIWLFQARIFIHIICMYKYIYIYLNGSYFIFLILIRYLYAFVIFCLVWVYGMYERAWQDAKK